MANDPITLNPPAVTAAMASSLAPRAIPAHNAGPVIFFDGVCGLCDAWISFVLARDRQQKFRFGALQGETAREWLQMGPDVVLDSVTLADATGIYRKSDAVWRILVILGGVWRVCGWLLRLVPRPIRNRGYDFIARHRYQWFEKKEACRLPTREERDRFLP